MNETPTNPIPIRFNEEEWLTHEWLKDFFGLREVFGEDSQTTKMAERVAMNVLRGTFGDELRDIFKRKSRDELLKIRAIQQEKMAKGNTRDG